VGNIKNIAILFSYGKGECRLDSCGSG